MRIPIYQVDAFAAEVFGGNPAAVCPLVSWPEDQLLQAIAAENNLAETAFLVSRGEQYELRWFTPKVEIDLCGHATLAAAYVVFHYLNIHLPEVRFSTRSGPLVVRREGALLAMDFPARPAVPCSVPDGLVQGLGAAPLALFKARDYLAVFASEAQVRELSPDFRTLARLDCLGVIASAPGESADFVSRFFAPAIGIDEDPVTGSAHCTLIPYWADRLGKKALQALQVSERGGTLFCEDLGERVKIAGEAAIYLEGTITV
ncbi:putative isomerase [Desulfuromonas versatilis]|uniref:Isomerase n=1 Tax=Desulfuromonas versatilis TaxID=2802975 RepID=A0ABM8HWS0_9BACT|nr:PhzF family phenazine biosynthesis protein [Desulfuromonas versatilis]BCR06784.1 putative isomerase [Desulfuromonas versatilis]